MAGTLKKVWRFYRDGFKNQTWGRPLIWLVVLKFFLLFAVLRVFFFKPALAVAPDGTVSMEPYKYLHNLLQMPAVLVMVLVGVVLVLAGLQSSLTIRNSSSSYFTLQVMSCVSLLIPFVVAYIAYAWHQMDRKTITEEEITGEEHKY